MKPSFAVVALFLAVVVAGCAEPPQQPRQIVGGDPERGQEAVQLYGCTSCHAIPGVASVDNDDIAPNLDGFDRRHYIAGQIPNRPEELVQWLRAPDQIAPGTVMPNLGVTEQDARDMAAFLYDQ
ncbi:hypothetical protein GCM10027404_26010 [Arthrobacter tumbae]|uniref:c-type cytochrome n=1 Tax=Arthrobacter tumbae TaxID=163874 RepID=UPI001957336C|nr:c-type cytochrome [Arthrobacter tumbae]MBM7781624.1 cytochrome c2 [Arthrobacter tumbae]